MLLMFRSRLQRSARVSCTTAWLARFGVTHDQKTRALACLEKAKLLTIERHHGKNPVVTLTPEGAYAP